MLRVFLLVNTYTKSQKIILSYPKDEDSNLLPNKALTEIFLSEGKTKHILDIIIGDYRYISCPIEIDNKKYFSSKILLNDDDIYEEKKKKFIKPKNFTLMFVFIKTFDIRKKLECIYKIIEKFSFCLIQEEYRTLYLAHELHTIYSYLESSDQTNKEESKSTPISLSPTSSSNKNKEKLPYLHLDNEKTNSSLFKTIKQLFEELTQSTSPFIKINLNNHQEFRFPLKYKNLEFTEINPYDSLIIYKKNIIIQVLEQSMDISPFYLFVISQANSVKSLFELSLEYCIDFTYISYIANQIQIWGLGAIIRKLHNHSIVVANSESKYISSKTESFFLNEFGINIYLALEKFIDREKISVIFKKYFTTTSPEKYLLMINFLLENQILVKCRKFILPRFKLNSNPQLSSDIKTEDPELMLIKKSQIAFKVNSKIDDVLKDFDSYASLLNRTEQFIASSVITKQAVRKESDIESVYSFDKERRKQNIFNVNALKGSITLEEVFKFLNNSEVDILNNIRYFLSKDFDYYQILFLTGYSDESLTALMEKYYYLFNVLIISDE